MEVKLFDEMTREERSIVTDAKQEGQRFTQQTTAGIVRFGNKLKGVKAALGHGRFIRCLDEEFKMTHQEAMGFMHVADLAFKFNKLLNLPFSKSALMVLATRSMPEAAIEESIARAEAGDVPTAADVKVIAAAVAEEGRIIEGDATVTTSSDPEPPAPAKPKKRGRPPKNLQPETPTQPTSVVQSYLKDVDVRSGYVPAIEEGTEEDPFEEVPLATEERKPCPCCNGTGYVNDPS